MKPGEIRFSVDPDIKVNSYKNIRVGDKVKIIKRGQIGWEIERLSKRDPTDMLGDGEFTVHSIQMHCKQPAFTLCEDRLKFYFHGNHFKKV